VLQVAAGAAGAAAAPTAFVPTRFLGHISRVFSCLAAALPREAHAPPRERRQAAIEGPEVREISRGIHPAILAEGGLGSALKTLARRSPIPVDLDVQVGSRLPERFEVAAYYSVSEVLTNAAKHSQASVVRVDVATRDSTLYVSVQDDGIGGADLAGGSGLVGLRDRVEALGGASSLKSPRGEGTSLEIELPLV
jgi:signal transduction histidine kinase